MIGPRTGLVSTSDLELWGASQENPTYEALGVIAIR